MAKLMKLITFFKSVFFLLIFVFSSVSYANTYKSQEKSNKNSDSASFIKKEWFDGDRRRVVWMSLNEVAVIGKKDFYTNINDLTRDVDFAFPQSKFIDKSSAYARIQLSDRFLNKQQLQNFLKKKNAGKNSWVVKKVYHNAADSSSPAFIAAEGIIVHFDEDLSKQKIEKWAKNKGFKILRFQKNGKTVLLDCKTNESCLDDANKIYKDQNVKYAYPNFIRPRQKKLQSPLFPSGNVDSFNNSSNLNIQVGDRNSNISTNSLWDDPLFEKQWYFVNTGQNNGLAGADVNILPVWEQGINGNGILAAIVDDGLELEHEDLIDNIAAGLSWDYVDNDNDPTAEFHGTSVAGILGATGNNTKGVVGTASGARLIGVRLLDANTDMNEADALSFRLDMLDLSNNSWGPPDNGRGLFGPSPVTEDALLAGVTNGRDGKGIVYCWAAGNGGANDNANYDGYANSRYTLAFTASTNQGNQASYAEKGANILANVPSNGGTLDVTTTDRTGQDGLDNSNYTDQFGGTSAATPLACGIVALIMEANPELTWRDIQAIIATTAAKNDPNDSDWNTNSAGYNINHKYGFGRIDASAAVEAAKNWILLDPLLETKASSSPDSEIPDNDTTGVSSSISINDNLSIETVEVVFSAKDHTYWGDLEISLQSPSGVESVLAELHDSGQNTDHYEQWKFTSLRHFGESSQGDWTLTVKDLATGDIGTFESWELNIYGTGEQSNQPNSDLSISVEDTPEQVNEDEQIVYSIIVSNNGPDKATAVVLTDNLPIEIEFSSVDTTQGSCNGSRQIICELGDILPGEKVNITLNTIASSAGNIINSISVSGNENDPFASNNTSAVETAILNNNLVERNLKITTNALVISNPGGIDCPSNCNATFPDGARVVLRVSSPNQFKNVFWIGSTQCSGNSDICELEIKRDTHIGVFAF